MAVAATIMISRRSTIELWPDFSMAIRQCSVTSGFRSTEILMQAINKAGLQGDVSVRLGQDGTYPKIGRVPRCPV